MEGIVIKKIADNFEVRTVLGRAYFTARGNLKKDGLFVGDKVIVDNEKQTIDSILPRQNLLVRPTFANLSQLVIVIAFVPQTDFAVVDKLLLFAFSKNIKPLIVVNKIDIAPNDYLDYVKKAYNTVSDLVFVSAKKGVNLEDLHNKLKGNISAFAGQSAVGKSALIKALYPKAEVVIGELSKKLERGKNTTRHTELFELEENTFLADTPGFSKLDVKYLNIDYHDLRYFYPDFLAFHENCKYKSCTHSNEKASECGVKKAVKENLLDKNRFERYLKEYELLKKEQEYD